MVYKLKIKGLTPYMQDRMDDTSLADWEKNRKLIIERPGLNETDLKTAEYHSYINDAGNFFIPAEHFKQGLINAGGYLKSKVGVSKKSMKGIVSAMFIVSPDQIPITPFDTIDKRSVVNRAVKGRVIKIRPKWTQWESEFTLTIGEETITEQTIKELIKIAGDYVGIGSYRPTANGSFGRFELVNINKVK